MVITPRSGSQCKKKWQDLGQVVSKEVAHNKRERTQTGGGPANLHPLTPLEERVAALMGPAWRKATTTAQYGPHSRERNLRPTLTRLQPMQKMIQTWTSLKRTFSNSTFQTKSVGGREVMDEAHTVVLTLEEMQVPATELPGAFLSGTRVGTFHGFSQSESADPSGVQQATPRVRRGRRAQQCSPEVQDLTVVVQMMARSAESIDLTQSLLDTISGVGDEVSGLSREVTTLSREMGTLSGNMMEGMLQAADTMSVHMR
uniref:uncharacterized protein n=1 Tax=Pristiophorus japonicus TaxID=55135 RepID=UPI00398E5869